MAEKDPKQISPEFITIDSGKKEKHRHLKEAETDDKFKIIKSSGHHHHHHSEESRKRRKKHKRKKLVKRILLIAGIAVLAIAVITAATFAVLYHTGKTEMKPDNLKIEAPTNVETADNGEYVYCNGHKYKYKSDIINMLFLGIDKNNGRESGGIGNNGMSDVIALAAIDSKANKATLINIPRDIMTDVKVYDVNGGYTGVEKMQIALSFAYGDGADTSCINTMSAVRSLFYNVPVSSYFALHMEGVPQLNDSIGGVTVKSPETIGQFVKGETYHLMGEDAFDFIHTRSMYTTDANLKRNERQKVYLSSFLKEFIKQTKADIGTPMRLFDASKPYSCTNLNANRITYLATEFIMNRDIKIEMSSVPVTYKLVGKNAENYVKEEEFYELFLKIFYDKMD